MMMRTLKDTSARWSYFAIALTLASCSSGSKNFRVASSVSDSTTLQELLAVPSSAPETTSIAILQINDVYEIAPIDGGDTAGFARLAWIRKELKKLTPYSLFVIAGDYLNPSAIGGALVDGSRLAGRQMVDVLNASGLDLAVLGNHEFDVSESEFKSRMNESAFQVISANVTQPNGSPFPKIQESAIFSWNLPPSNRVFKLGFAGVTIDSNPRPYVKYQSWKERLSQSMANLATKTDLILGLTHLTAQEDQEALKLEPRLLFIMGGHEHELQVHEVNRRFVYKADSNARTAWLHWIQFSPSEPQPRVTSRFIPVDTRVPEDSNTAARVNRWMDLALEGFRKATFDPNHTVATLSQPWDGRSSTVRAKTGELTRLIADGLKADDPKADVAFFNGGSVRVDDWIGPGAISEYDLIRILPFGGDAVSINLLGSTLIRLATTGDSMRGQGAFLHWSGLESCRAGWCIRGKPIEPNQTYRAVTNDFLANGREVPLSFLKIGTEGTQLISNLGDLRRSLIRQLERQ